MPLLSIITINYNNKEGLQKTFRSIFSQTYQDFEYIVIDGGSKDGSREIIENHTENIDFWVSEPDKGIYNAMNKGILHAKGEYLLFINSGDEIYNINTLKDCLSYLHTYDIITGNLNIISDTTDYIAITSKITFSKLFNGTIWHPCTFMKKNAFNKTEMYDESLKIVSDWKWFLLGIFKNDLSYKHIEMTIAKFYLDGISNQKESHKLLMSERENVLRENFPNYYDDYIELTNLREYNNTKKYVIVKRSTNKLAKKIQSLLLVISKKLSNN